jgi:hypothetical protein
MEFERPRLGLLQAAGPLARATPARYDGRMQTVFNVLIPVLLVVVVAVLFVGIYALFRGGDFGRSYSNKLMRLRVVAQAVAILAIVAAVWWRRHAAH